MATVLLTAQGTTPSAELIQALQSDIAGFVTDFHITTRGRARIDTSTPALKHTVFLSVIVTGSGPERQANPH